MKLTDLTRSEKKDIKKEGRRCDCALTYPDTCTRCLNRAAKRLLQAISERERGPMIPED